MNEELIRTENGFFIFANDAYHPIEICPCGEAVEEGEQYAIVGWSDGTYSEAHLSCINKV